MNKLITIWALLWASAGFAAGIDFSASDAWLGDAQEEAFLPVDEAFRLTATMNANGVLLARWEMPDGYYLYRHQFGFESGTTDLTLGEAAIPPGEPKFDEFFGDVEVYYQSAEIAVPVLEVRNSGGEIGVSYQGCADRGLCYPPETRWFSYDGALLVAVSEGVSAFNPAAGSARSEVSADAAPGVPAPSAGTGIAATEERLLAGVLADESLLYALALFFIAGIGLAFTPCVLPMVPILSSIIVGEGEQISRRRAFTLSLAYVLGMAVTYALIGMLVGLFGAELNMQAALQSPPVLVFFAAVFAVLSLSMFGFYELRLPGAWQARLDALSQRQQGGKHASVVVMGALSSLLVSPCVSAPLAGALIYISTTNDAVLGGSALLSLGLGMGVPLMLVGASGGHWLPRAGAWMEGVKAFFGVLLLAVAVWLLERVVPAAVTLALWAALLLGSGVYLGVLDSSPRHGVAQFGKAVGTLGFLWGILLLIGAASGASDPLKPLARLVPAAPVALVSDASSPMLSAHGELAWIAVKSVDDVQAEIRSRGQPAILDLYADWCISCKVMERSVFPVPEVAAGLSQFTRLRADVTDNDDIDQALLAHYGLFGPPSLVFFAGDGVEIEDVRIQGEIDADALADHLNNVIDYLSRPEFEKTALNTAKR